MLDNEELETPRIVPSKYEYYIGMAEYVKSRSKDRSTQVGAVLVGEDGQIISTGYNGFPRGFNDSLLERHQRPAKYEFTEHAERNAIYNAARTGTPTAGTTMFMDSSPWPCSPCARAIVQSGVKYVVGRDIAFKGKGAGVFYSPGDGRDILIEGQVGVVILDENFVIQELLGSWNDIVRANYTLVRGRDGLFGLTHWDLGRV